jgi:hypothetical protein
MTHIWPMPCRSSVDDDDGFGDASWRMLFEEVGDMMLWLLMAFSFSAGACFGAVMLSLFVTQPILSSINRSNMATPLTDRINPRF